MKTPLRFGLAAGALLLAGCGNNSTAATLPVASSGPTSTTASSPTQTPSISVPPTTTPVLQKTIGQWAGAGNQCGGTPQSCTLAFRITKVTDCTGRYAGDPPPAGTERRLIWLEISTGSQYDGADLPSSLVTQFSAIDAAGVTSGNINPSTSWKCAPEGQRIGFGDETWRPGKKYAGAVEVYLPKDAVKVTNGDGVWEWSLGR
jgi:hypothetical protein